MQTTWRGWGTPASANRSRCFSFEVASTAVAGSIGCDSASRSAILAAIATGQSIPGAIRPSIRSAVASRSICGSSSTEMIARRSAKEKPGAAGSRSAAIT